MVRGPRRAAAAMCGGWAALSIAWAIGNPPFASPDEWAHYLRASGIHNGRLVGPRDPYPTHASTSESSRLAQAWINDAARSVHVAPRMFAFGLDCDAAKPSRSARCLGHLQLLPASNVRTPVGNYQPLPYLLPSLGLITGHGPFVADRIARLLCVLVNWLFLVVAVRMVWTGSRYSLLGPLLAVSPMVLFIASSLNPSGFEVTSGIAFAACVLRLSREERAPPWVWATTGAVGCALAMSRSPAPLWIVLDVAVLVGLVGLRESVRRLSIDRGWATAAALAISVGVALNVWWERSYGSHARWSPHGVLTAMPHGARRVPAVVRDYVGNFGSLDTPLPIWAVASWLICTSALLVLAIRVGSTRERAVLAALTMAQLVIVVAFSALLLSGTGFDVQGRHTLAFAVLVPLVAGEIVLRHRDRLDRIILGRLTSVTATIAGGIQLFAWYWNARRQSVGSNGPLDFFGAAQWSPPGGWLTWLVVAILGAGLVISSGAVGWRSGQSPTA